MISFSTLCLSRPILVSSSSSRPSMLGLVDADLANAGDGLAAAFQAAGRRTSRWAVDGGGDGVVDVVEDAPVAVGLAVARRGLAVAHAGQDFLHDAADQFIGDLHAHGCVSVALAVIGYHDLLICGPGKIVLFSTFTVSTMPMMVASTGNFSVSGVRRALEPCTISTISPSPAPTVSTHDKRPAGADRAGRGRRIDTQRLDGQQFVADHAGDFLRRHHAAGDSGEEHGLSCIAVPAISHRIRQQLLVACRATINSSLVGMIHNCTRLFARMDRHLALGLFVGGRVEMDAEPVQVGTDRRTHRWPSFRRCRR